MASTYKLNLKQILDTEEQAERDIERAMLEKKEIIQREREKTEKEIEAFRNDEMNKMNKEINELTSNKALEEQLLSQHKFAIDKIENDYRTNKDKAVTFLVNALMEVDLSIPDVIIGRFAHKLLLNKGK